MIDFREPIEIEGLRVNQRRHRFRRCGRVLVVPREAEEEIFVGALEKARGEQLVRKR